MANFRWSGWCDVVVEVRWTGEAENFQAFVTGVGTVPAATLLPSGGASEALDALLPGQGEECHYVRLQGPPLVVMTGLQALFVLCHETFPEAPTIHEPPFDGRAG